MAPETAGSSIVTLEDLASQISALQAEVERLRALLPEGAESGGVGEPAGAAESTAGPTADSPPEPDSAEEIALDRTVSRRGALRALGAAAAGGAGLAMGSAFLSADPAAAVSVDLVLDQGNSAATSNTALSGTQAAEPVMTVNNFDTASPGPALYAVNDSPGAIPLVDVIGTGLVGSPAAIVAFGGSGTAIYGQAVNVGGRETIAPTGVFGDTGDQGATGVLGRCGGVSGIGVFANDISGSPSSIGLNASSAGGTGVIAQGGLVPLQLVPTSTEGCTVFEGSAVGQVMVDAGGDFYVCTAVSPPVWQAIALAAPNFNDGDPGSVGVGGSINLLSSPIRVFDSRTTGATANPANPSRPAGPTVLGTPITLKIANITVGSISIPAGAVGVIGNVTVTIVSGGGWLTLYPAGAPKPTTSTPSTLNFQASDSALANACTVALGTSGSIDILAFQASSHVIFDVTGFIY
jgi:hypothetical protein